MTTDTGKAERDEQCAHCGYPFDTGEKVTVDEDGRAYCGKDCQRGRE